MKNQKFLPNPDALNGKRWAMVVDMKKCNEDCNDCIKACHQVHNVPDLGNPKDEVKWIWKEPYDKNVSRRGSKYTRSTLTHSEGKSVYYALQPL